MQISLYGLWILHHLVLPAFTSWHHISGNHAYGFRAPFSRGFRPQIAYSHRTCLGGIGTPSVLFKHALRNAALPILDCGPQLATLISGALLVEKSTIGPAWDFAFDSILRRDYPTIIYTLFCLAMVVIANLITDLSYRLADPRFGGNHERS